MSDELREKIHRTTSLFARRIVGEASKKTISGDIIVQFNNEADNELLALIPDIEEAKKQERERIVSMLEGYNAYKIVEGHPVLEFVVGWQALKE